MAKFVVDPNLMEMSLRDWADARDNQPQTGYGIFAKYEGDTCEIIAQWQGEVGNSREIPREYWNPWEVLFNNIVSEVVIDPITGERALQTKRIKDFGMSMKFTTVNDMMNYYQRALETGTNLTPKEILDTQNDTVEGYYGDIPKHQAKKDMEELEELVMMDEIDKPNAAIYGDGGW